MLDYSAVAGRTHVGRRTIRLVLSAEERARIEDALRPAKAEQRVVRRAQAVLMMAEAVPAPDIARLVGVHVRTVETWRKRFECEHPSELLAAAPRSGRPPSLSRNPTQPE